MLYKNREEFKETIYRTVKHTGFTAQLLEKDYYLTLLLSKIHNLSNQLVFKGGTCLNKIYYSYYRLSEDLDFSIQLPEYTVTRGQRRRCIQPVKDKIVEFAAGFDMKVDNPDNAGYNLSKQYIYKLMYNSVLRPNEMTIKLEIGLRYSPIIKTEIRHVQHKFIHPFTGEPLFDAGMVNCLSLIKIVSEKLRAAALRRYIAPRDFYDLDFIIRSGFDFSDHSLKELVIKKIDEDKGNTDLSEYVKNLGRSNDEIKSMKSRIELELLDVLTLQEKQKFDIDKALDRINVEMAKLIK